MKKIKVLSLFDGISCGRVALERAGFEVETYYASEIDKYATQVSQKNWPEIIRLGDVTKWKEWDIEWSEIDLILAGSPCQGFSFAGKQLAFNDPRSALFFEFVNILNHVRKYNPDVKFLLENVKMKQQHMDIISGLLDEYPVMINSASLSAQTRKRLYWANWDFIEPSHGKDEILANILQPDSEVDEKYYFDIDIDIIINKDEILKLNKKGKLKQNQDKASCLTAGGNSGGNHSDMDIIAKGCAKRGRYNQDGSISQKIEIRNDDKSNCLTTVSKDSLLIKEATKKGYTVINPGNSVDLTFPKSKTRRGRNMKDKSNCITATKCDYCKYTNDYRLRRYTPIEYERLQTLPDNYTAGVSDTQRCKALGNGWTVDVIAHILKRMEA